MVDFTRIAADAKMVFRFGRNELNPTSFELRRSNRRVQLAARPMELLLLLVNRRGELVTREEIARSLWPGMNVEDLEARINTAIAQIRAALGEDASKPRFIETVFGKGYRFVGVVEAESRETVAAGKSPAVPAINGTGVGDPLPGTAPVATHTGAAVSPPSPALGSDKRATAELDLSGQHSGSAPLAEIPRAGWTASRLLIAGFAALVCIIVAAGILEATLKRAKIAAAKPHEWTSTQITTNDSDNPINTAAISPNGGWLAYA